MQALVRGQVLPLTEAGSAWLDPPGSCCCAPPQVPESEIDPVTSLPELRSLASTNGNVQVWRASCAPTAGCLPASQRSGPSGAWWLLGTAGHLGASSAATAPCCGRMHAQVTGLKTQSASRAC